MDHVKQTIAELRSDRAALDDLITRLEVYARLKDEPTAAAQPVVATAKAEPAPVAKPRKPVKVAKSRATGAQSEAIACVRGLKEPFRSGDVQAALGCDYKKASNIIVRFKAKGWLTQVGFGEYNRSKKFPAVVAEPTATTQSRAMLDEIHKEIEAEKDKE